MLSPKDVRNIAAGIPCREIKSKRQSDILSFLLKDTTGEPARVNVYCQSGTVGTCRVLNGEVREMFVRKCTLRQVHEILSEPIQLPNVDQNVTYDHEKEQEEREPGDDACDDENSTEEKKRAHMASLKDDELKVDVGLSILANEFDNLMTNFKSLSSERQMREKAMEKNQMKKKSKA